MALLAFQKQHLLEQHCYIFHLQDLEVLISKQEQNCVFTKNKHHDSVFSVLRIVLKTKFCLCARGHD